MNFLLNEKKVVLSLIGRVEIESTVTFNASLAIDALGAIFRTNDLLTNTTYQFGNPRKQRLQLFGYRDIDHNMLEIVDILNFLYPTRAASNTLMIIDAIVAMIRRTPSKLVHFQNPSEQLLKEHI